mmetsp:Transcript_2328/g.3042  ORF Transcript_2328/g.3042 Transcript_2328/m.3042 type:complete len:256 (+) Transcript_2328:311-1078(+)
MLPGRTDNTVKNYFYATVRRHLRKLNKCLRTPKFCEVFNIEPKQVKVNFLIDALEAGHLNFIEIRSIENKELMALSKKKLGVYNRKVTAEEKKALAKLDGKGKSIDKNLKLLKDMLSLVECNLEAEPKDDDDDNSQDEFRSVSVKNATGKNEESPQNRNSLARQETGQKRFKKLEIDTFEEEKRSEYGNENGDNEDDVNFHDIPMINTFKPRDLTNKQERLEFYQEIYRKRREQKRKGKWNVQLSNYAKLIFSYP